MKRNHSSHLNFHNVLSAHRFFVEIAIMVGSSWFPISVRKSSAMSVESGRRNINSRQIFLPMERERSLPTERTPSFSLRSPFRSLAGTHSPEPFQVCCGFTSRAQDSGLYLPYQFQYSIDHPEGGQSSRVEKGDKNAVTGSYQITTVDGFKRVSTYIFYSICYFIYPREIRSDVSSSWNIEEWTSF